MGAFKRLFVMAAAMFAAMVPSQAFAQLDGETESLTWDLFCQNIAAQQDGTVDMCAAGYQPRMPQPAPQQQPQQVMVAPAPQAPVMAPSPQYAPPAQTQMSDLPANAWSEPRAQQPVEQPQMADADPQAPFDDSDFEDDNEKWWLIGSGIGTTLLMVLGILIAL